MSSLRILGIDPGSRRTGYALAEFRGGEIVALELGSWSLPARGRRSAALARLLGEVEAWLADRHPDVAAVEGLFQHRNVRSALALAEARGVVLAALGRAGIDVVEYAPAAIKKCVCGNGTAPKDQVRRALARTVPGLSRFPLADYPEDATDALAAAVCHRAHASFEGASVR
ncbi:MAG: crossover junction endodeoxyribonuclease RuvC [Acidobacteria bacterium]|nr:MAG: crossover junction endodeoxyribonuclease RuvC [Acidobacteriota bacterium]